MEKTTFASLLKKMRKHAKMSIEDLSSVTGTSLPSLYGYERGVICPSLGTARKIAKAFNKTLSIFDEVDLPGEERKAEKKKA